MSRMDERVSFERFIFKDSPRIETVPETFDDKSNMLPIVAIEDSTSTESTFPSEILRTLLMPSVIPSSPSTSELPVFAIKNPSSPCVSEEIISLLSPSATLSILADTFASRPLIPLRISDKLFEFFIVRLLPLTIISPEILSLSVESSYELLDNVSAWANERILIL